MYVSLMTIQASLDDIRYIIKACPLLTEFSMPGQPKQFIAIGISITAMSMASFNTYRMMQLDAEITSLKGKTDLRVDVSHLHEAHLHHLEDKTDATNKLLGNVLEANIRFSSKIMDAIEKKNSISGASS
jgi:hypothetical protein